ncbi:lanthionine synthetase C family protein [Streptomyces sp. NPDC060006]|uniref:lanthionine synthetase C family protein n=1 Tax=unclassified Streptomyces TaxID=2593676 RepID=UPI00368DAAFE
MIAPAAELSTALADLLADPETAPLSPSAAAEDRQHIAYGLPGIALLHIERAAAGLAPWHRAHTWLAAAARQPLTSGTDSHPFYGAPALAQVLACATDHLPGSYERALNTLDKQIARDVLRRLTAAHRRLDTGHLPDIAEFDTIRGLSGYGAYLLRRTPGSAAVRTVLDYCVRLTKPITRGGETLPGWWTPTAPTGRPDTDRFPEGHANSGMSHGIGGVLALLALAARHGTVVDEHHDAMRTILVWLDRWQEETSHGPAWPYWVTRAELRNDRLAPSTPRRPSWCYGTAGLARAQQLAALALGDSPRRIAAENALVATLTDTAQLKATTDNGLCHGFAGLAHVTARTAADAHPSTAGQLQAIIPPLLATICPPGTDPATAAPTVANEAGPGFLDGAAGIALALLAPTTTPPRTAWDACLLIA